LNLSRFGGAVSRKALLAGCDGRHIRTVLFMANRRSLYKAHGLPNTGRATGEFSMAEEQKYDDNVVKFSVGNGQQPGTYELYIKTKSEEFDFQISAEMLQQLGDAIYEAIDKNEGGKQ